MRKEEVNYVKNIQIAVLYKKGEEHHFVMHFKCGPRKKMTIKRMMSLLKQ